MNALWLLLIPYTTLAYGIHGGELIQNINRQVRNLICALPFTVVGWYLFGPYGAAAGLLCGYFGSNLGFDNHPLWLKGFINLPPFGALLLPAAYADKNLPAATCEYISGFLYGTALAVIAILKSHI